MCVDRIEKALCELEGVNSVRVDLEKKTAAVEFETARVKIGRIQQAIADAGYTADSVSRDSLAYEELPGCCQ